MEPQARRKKRTFGIIAGVPFAISRDSLANLEHDYSATECYRKPSASAGEAPDPFSKLELGYFASDSIIPEHDLVWRVERTSPTAKEK